MRSRLAAALREARMDLLREADDASRGIARILARAETRMLKTVASKGATEATKREQVKLLAQLNRIALDARPEVAAWLRGELPTGALNGMRTQARMLAAALGKQSFDEIPVQRLKDAFAAFEQAIESKQILPLSDKALMQRWGDLWDERTKRAMRSMQADFIEGIARGESWSQIATRITDEAGGLAVRGDMAADDWARGFTRAKMTEIANTASTKSASLAGITKFINVGVPDDRQSEECETASARDALTEDEWDATGEGPPPRHVFNCRCLLAGVPEFAEEEILEEVQA